MLKFVRYAAWALVLIVGFVSTSILMGWWVSDRSRTELPPAIGGAFSLVDHTGKAVTDADFRGSPLAVFFGFTHCPEVCPTTLLRLNNLTRQLGTDAARLKILLITVDPERDTPAQLALYLQSFDPVVIGLTGSQAQIDAALQAYKAYAKKVPVDGGYTMYHTANVYLMTGDGAYRTMIDYHEADSSALAKLRMLLR
ncbi:SCO family protein [uncultured Bosea sp.]|uniref:SCO family protein n=1 Tax=uncultured Bosea sp. TaxID=211457 RepID=UPI0025F29A60|nr:SCO family protein [uncultured Bosea sp.]